MSTEELSRLVKDVMASPVMISETMAITDQSAMDAYIKAKGYDLTRQVLDEVWTMTAKVLAGHAQSMGVTEQLIQTARAGL